MKYWFKYDKDDKDWPIKHCLNKMLNSNHFCKKLRNLIIHGECGGEVDWHLMRWSEGVASDFCIEKYDGFMGYLGYEEHGLHDNDIYAVITSLELISYLDKACDFYLQIESNSSKEIADIKELFSCLVS